MAPAGAVALSIAASSIDQPARHLPSAGSIYTYAAESIHPAVGFLVGWGYSLVEALIGPITMILFGYLVSSVTRTEFGWPFTTAWVIFMIAASLIIAALNYRGV
jgi:amino acid transporter